MQVGVSSPRWGSQHSALSSDHLTGVLVPVVWAGGWQRATGNPLYLSLFLCSGPVLLGITLQKPVRVAEKPSRVLGQ